MFSRAFLVVVALLAMIAAGIWYFIQRFSVKVSNQSPMPVVVPVRRPVNKIELPESDNSTFEIGEKLHYEFIFKGATVGNSTLEVKNGPSMQNRPTIQYVLKAQSTKFFDSFFKVSDDQISTVDTASLYSVAFDQDLHEGRTRAMHHYTFDYEKGKFTWSEQGKGKAKNKNGPLHEPTYDVLSALYALRTRELKPGQSLKLPIFRHGQMKLQLAKINPELKVLNTPLGKISCLRVEPLVQEEPLFKDQDNWLAIWITDDRNKLPVLIEANTHFGLMRIKLDKWIKNGKLISDS